MTVIYGDTVFMMNTALDYLLLRSAAALTAAPGGRLRSALAAGAGGAYAVGVFLPGLEGLHHPLVRLLWSLLLTWLAFGGGRGLLRRWGVFLLVSGALAGMLVLVGCLSSTSLGFPKGVPVDALDGRALLLAGALCWWCSDLLLRRLIPAKGRELVPVRLYWGERHSELTALLDSGNLLTDASGRPVLVAEAERVLPLLPQQISVGELADPACCMARWGPLWGTGRVQLLPYQSTGVPHALLLAVRMDMAQVGERRVPRLLVALSPTPLSSGAFQGIIGTDY